VALSDRPSAGWGGRSAPSVRPGRAAPVAVVDPLTTARTVRDDRRAITITLGGLWPPENERRISMSMSFDPFSQLDRIAQSVFDTSRQPRMMPVDLFREGDQYVLNADLPGVDPGSVDVDVDGHLLTIRAQRSAANRENARWLAQERPFGSYMRQFSIGDDVNSEGISASYDNGVLSVVIPIAERAKRRKIAVDSASENQKKAVAA
jgi:HSP20 family protein